MNRLLKVIFSSILLTISYATVAQSGEDESFLQVRKLAENEDWVKASVLLDSLIDQNPANTDYLLYKPRLLAWQERYKEALESLDALKEYPQTQAEANEIRLFIYLWSKQSEKVVQLADTCIAEQPEKSLYFTKIKTQAYLQLQDFDRALIILDSLKTLYSKDKELGLLQSQIYQRYSRSIGVSHLHTFFLNSNLGPWFLSAVEFAERKAKHAYVLRYNQGQTFGQLAGQIEADWYPKTGPKSYAYLNIGYSGNNIVFPMWRAGAEWYRTMNKSLTASAGLRYLSFTSSQVWLYTGHIQYNRGAFSGAYRPFLLKNGQDWLPTHTLTLTANRFSVEQKVQLNVQYGVNPYLYTSTSEFSRIQSTRWGISYDFRVSAHWLGRLSFMQEYEEYVPSLFRRRVYIQGMVYYRFGSFVK